MAVDHAHTPPGMESVCDLDEFVFATEGTVADYLTQLADDVGRPGRASACQKVSLRWIMFGSSGHQNDGARGVRRR